MDTAAGQCKRRRERKGNFFVYFFLSSHFLKSWGEGTTTRKKRKGEESGVAEGRQAELWQQQHSIYM